MEKVEEPEKARNPDGGDAHPMEVVYLIHLDSPYPRDPRGSVRHYLGTTTNLESRLNDHRIGRGSPLLRAVTRKGIPFSVVRLWTGGRELERSLKRQNNAARYCPVCREEKSNL